VAIFLKKPVLFCGPISPKPNITMNKPPLHTRRLRNAAASHVKTRRLAPLTLAVLAALSPLVSYAANGMTDLGGGTNSTAYGVSADGSVVVGQGYFGPANNAFRWTQAGGMQSLGTLNGGSSSLANGVSADGSTIVGWANDGASDQRAFRWTQAGGMQNLGLLSGGTFSIANGVSADGSVVVGQSSIDNAGDRQAFRWTNGSGMQNLGGLNGAISSIAYAVSADGSVVVGQAEDGTAGNATRAFLWTQTSGMVSLGTLNNGATSYAKGVSADGSVVVGQAADGAARNALRAFRWTQAGGMKSLGVLNGGNSSYAYGVSADGSVVVGQAADGAAGNAKRAFRWTQASGMQSVEQWLAANGVTVTAGMATLTAKATNADGSVVVGQLANSHAFVARIVNPDSSSGSGSGTGAGSGMIDVVDFNKTLLAPVTAFAHVQANAQTSQVINGLHSSPMSDVLGAGQRSAWVSGDWGRQDNSPGSGDVGSGEVGLAYGVSNDVMVKLALGRTYSQQGSEFGGDTTFRGNYLLPELIFGIPSTALKLGLSGYYNIGDANIKRGYLNAGTPVISAGDPDAHSEAWRLRLDWPNAATYGALGVSPYTSLTYFHSHIDGYTETGGGFPVQWDSRNDYSTEARLGSDVSYELNNGIRLLGRLEGVHRLKDHSSGASGQILGLGNFDLAGMNYRQDWLRAGVGLESKVGPGVASVMLNKTTENNGLDWWAYASYRITF